jgi:hypothetical protein
VAILKNLFLVGIIPILPGATIAIYLHSSSLCREGGDMKNFDQCHSLWFSDLKQLTWVKKEERAENQIDV